MKISAVIIAGNEEANIADAIRSVEWADEVLVIDSESTDRTREIAIECGASVITRPWPGFARQKQFGTDNAANDWVLSLDADERVSPELRSEIEEIRQSGETVYSGFRIPRSTFYMGREIRHSGWYPDWQLRLFDRTKGRWKDVLVHESFAVTDGKVGRLSAPIIHYSINDASDHNRMIGERYAPLAARQMWENGRRTNVVKLAAAAPVTFFSSYVLKAGFLDGIQGYFIARFAAHHAFMKHLCLWEIQRAKKG